MAEKKFGGREFRVGTVLATDAIVLQARLMQLVGNGLGQLPLILASRVEGATAEQRAAGDAAAIAALGDICSKCEPATVSKLLQDIIALVVVHRPSGSWEKADLDGDFTDHKGDIFPVVLWALREVLGDFFSGLQASGALKRMAAA